MKEVRVLARHALKTLQRVEAEGLIWEGLAKNRMLDIGEFCSLARGLLSTRGEEMEDAAEMREALVASEAVFLEAYKDRTLAEACLGMEQAVATARSVEPPSKRRRADIPIPEPAVRSLTPIADFLKESAMRDLAGVNASSIDPAEGARRQKEVMSWVWRRRVSEASRRD